MYPRVCRTELERFFIAIDRLVPIGMLQRVGASALADHLQLGSRLPFEFQEPLRPLNLGSRRPTAARRFDRDTGRQALAMYKNRASAKPRFHDAPRVALVARRLDQGGAVIDEPTHLIRRNHARVDHALRYRLGPAEIARTSQHQLHARFRVSGSILLEGPKQQVGVLRAVATAKIEEIPPGPELRKGGRVAGGRATLRYFDAGAANDAFAQCGRSEETRRERRLTLGDEKDALRRVDVGLDLRKVGICLVVEQRLQDGSPLRARYAQQGRAVEVRNEDHGLIAFALTLQVPEQLRRVDVLLDEGTSGCFRDRARPQPLGPVVQGQELLIGRVEGGGVARADRKASDGHARFLRNAFGEAVALPVVAERGRARREHLDAVPASREPGRDLEDVLLCPAEQIPPEPGDDECRSRQGR